MRRGLMHAYQRVSVRTADLLSVNQLPPVYQLLTSPNPPTPPNPYTRIKPRPINSTRRTLSPHSDPADLVYITEELMAGLSLKPIDKVPTYT